MRAQTRTFVALAAAALAACSRPPAEAPVDAHADAHAGHDHGPVRSFTNGDFEGGTLTGWTVNTYLNPGLAAAPPTLRSQLNLGAGGLNYTKVLSGAAETVLPAGLTAGASLRIPKYGSNVVVVNESGMNRNVNGIKQSMTVTNADVDPNDGKAHVRFAMAPVLQNPGHTAVQQPYFWATLTNVTKGNLVLFSTFNYSNQAGVPWKADPVNTTTLYTDWLSLDISPGAATLAVGDVVELEVIAGGCSLGGHFGQVYLDGIGAYLPGLAVSATAPASVNSGSTLTYTFNYSNHGIDAAPSTVITEVLPTGTTFASISAPGATCTTPAVGATGTVTCNVGTLNPASVGSFTLTVNVTGASGTTISNGNYSITAASLSPLTGPLVTTAVTSGVTYVDLATTATDGVAAVNWGAATTYTVTVRNNGPSAANGTTIAVPVPTNVSAFGTWSCVASGGAACGAASGSGAIATTANLPSAGQVTYTIPATIAAGSGTSSISLLATATKPAAVTDTNTSNDVAADYDQVGTLRTLTVSKTGGGAGTILSSPVAISCGTACASQSAVFLDGTSVDLTATTAPGNRFMSWTAGPCSGSTSPICTVPLTADTTATASFLAADWLVNGSAPAGNGTVTCTSPLLNGQSSACTITPGSRYRLTALTDNGTSVIGAVAGGTYTIASVTADHNVVGTFSANTDTTAVVAAPVSPSVWGQSVTFTATVTAGAPAGTPTGTVDFLDGATTLCAARPLAAGVATCTTSALAMGAHSITATYGADATYPSSTSSALAFTVNKASSATALAAAPVSPSVFGQSVTFTATLTAVAPGSGTPGGTVTFTDGAATLCAAVAVSGGTASCTTSALAVGAHSVVATATGNASFNGSASSALAFTVNKASSATALAAAPVSPSVFGQSVTFTATLTAVAPGSGTPGGTVTFTDGAATLCAAVAVSGGTASCTTSALAVGAHSVVATATGNASFNGSASSALAFTVNKASSATALAAAPVSPSVFGQSVTFTATLTAVAPGSGTPGGTVTFTDGAATLCAAVAVSGGTASCTTSALAVGAHSVVATAAGDASFNGSASSALAFTVNKAASGVAVSTSGSPSLYGASVTFTATVTGGAVTPTGSVTFSDGATTLCASAAVSGGIATCSTSILLRGSHTITASYGGDASYGPASANRIQLVDPADPIVALLASPAPSVFGQDVLITVAVGGSGLAPTGTVTITEGATVLCGGPLTLVAGAASCHKADLAVGDHLLAAAYAGDANYTAGNLATTTHTVGRALTDVAIDVSPGATVFGQPYVITATVTVPAPGAGNPGGTVDFYDGATLIGTATVDPATGIATLTIPPGSPLAVGDHTFSVGFGGDGNFQGSLSPTTPTYTVAQADSLVTVTPTRTPSVFGELVTYTFEVTAVAPGAGTPGGTITVSVDGALPFDLPLVGGSATWATDALAVGPHAFAVTYPGDASFLPSSGGHLQAVDPAATAVTATASPAPSDFGQPVTFTLTVAAVAPGAGTPTGTIRLLDGATLLATATLDAGGQATPVLSSLAVGGHTLAVEYDGDGSFAPGSGTVDHVVQRAASAAALAVSDPAPAYGAPVTFTAVATPAFPGAGIPGGSIAFWDGATLLAVVPLDAAGLASFTTSGLPPGGHAIVAVYTGDPSFLGSSSAATAVAVLAAQAAVTLASSPNPSAFGERVSWDVQAVAVAPSLAVPDGSVEVYDGATLLGTLSLDAAGRASGGSAALAVGSHPLSAVLVASPRFAAASSAVQQQVVVQAQVSVALGAAPSPSIFGAAVTFTARLTVPPPGTGLPSGTVTFTEGAQVLGSAAVDAAGEAQVVLTNLSTGSHQVTAGYGGDAGFAPRTSPSFLQLVTPAGTTTVAAAAPTPSAYGQPVTFSASVTSAAGVPGGRVDFLEGGVTLLGSGVLDGSGHATFTTSALAVGSHPVTARYAGATDYQGSDAAPVTAVVQLASTTVTLAVGPSPAVAGQPVTLTATVAVVAPGAGIPGGTVTFLDGTTVLGTAVVDPVTGVATLVTGSLPVGDHAITVAYPGDPRFAPSASGAPTSLAVAKASVTVAVATTPSASVAGEPVLLTVTVTAAAPGAGTPTGTVTLTDGATALGPVTLSGGTGQLTTTLPVGDRNLAASYEGDPAFLPGTGSHLHVVGQAATTTSLASSGSPSAFGQAITLTATVRPVAPGAGNPGGTVTFKDGAVVLGTGTVGAAGTATLTTSALAPGLRVLSAGYGGDAAFTGSVGTATQDVQPSTTSVAVQASPSPAAYGQPVTVTVTLTAPGDAIPSGTVTLLDGVTVIGTATLDASGVATFTLSSPGAGTHSLTVTFAGGAGFAAGSGGTTLTVTPGTSTLDLASSRNPSRAGRPVTFTATATSDHATPIGTVTFKDGTTVLGTADLAGGVARLTTRTLTKGTHPVTAELAASADFAAASAVLAGGQLVENTPPVAGSGTGLAFGAAGATTATFADPAGALVLATGTVEVWVKPGWTSPAAVTGTPSILRLGPAAGPRLALGVSPDRLQLVVTSGAGTQALAAPLDDGGWHHVALQSAAGTVRALVDGIEVASAAGAFADAAGPLVLGEGFLGELDEVRIWSTARTAAELADAQRRPLGGAEQGLVGLWRFDEGMDPAAGVELFDASPSHLDGTAALAAGATSAFAPSAAWRHRVGQEERPLAPVDAGYDADGDPLTLAVTAGPAHGAATADQAALQVGYRPGAGFLGEDGFTFSLTDDDAATSSYAIDVTVERILLCQVSADCGGGDLCVTGVCTPPSDLYGRSGGCGCTSTSGSASVLWAFLALGLLGRRRRLTVPAGARRLLGVALLLGAATATQAQTTPAPAPKGFALQLFEPAPTGDPLFSVSGTATEGDRVPAAGLVLAWATDPLVLRVDGQEIPGGTIVHRQFWAWATGAMTFRDRFLVDVALPVALYQSGSQPIPELAPVAAFGLGDLRLGGRYRIGPVGPLELATGLTLWLPTGSREAFASDGSVRVEPKLMVSGRTGPLEYGAEAGLLYRASKDLLVAELGTAIPFAAGAAYHWGAFRAGPELFGRYQFSGSVTSPVETLLGAHYQRGAFDYGLALGTSLNMAAGAAPFRVIGQMIWRPDSGAAEAAARAAAAKAEADRLASQAAADQEAAERAAAAAAAAKAAEQAEADRLAAERARLAADRDGDGIPDVEDACPDQPGVASADPARHGCPAPAPALVKLTRERIEILQSVQFETAKDVIRPESEALLTEVAQVLVAHPELTRVMVEGHTDSQGGKDFNVSLSEKRARSVKRWLVERGGVDAARLQAEGYGPSRPLDTNDTKEGRARNRRVEFRIVEQR